MMIVCPFQLNIICASVKCLFSCVGQVFTLVIVSFLKYHSHLLNSSFKNAFLINLPEECKSMVCFEVQ